MGYASNFTINIIRGEFDPEEVDQVISKVSGYGNIYTGEPTDRIKWYDMSKDMSSVSRIFPDLMFEVTSVGEDGERSCSYFCNGTLKEAQVVIVYGGVDLDEMYKTYAGPPSLPPVTQTEYEKARAIVSRFEKQEAGTLSD